MFGPGGCPARQPVAAGPAVGPSEASEAHRDTRARWVYWVRVSIKVNILRVLSMSLRDFTFFFVMLRMIVFGRLS